jgi:hypothetical protein
MHGWSLAEAQNGGIVPISYELLRAARDIADLLAARAEAALIGKDVEALTDELVSRRTDGVDVVPALLEELRAQRA